MPSTPSISVTLTSPTNVRVVITSGLDTSHVQIDRSWVSGTGTMDDEIYTGSQATVTQNYTPPTVAGTYYIYARARIGSTASSWVSRSFVVSPPADPDPSIQSMSSNGNGKISVSWLVGNLNYMRSSDSFRIYMSGANNSTMHDMGYYDASTREFERKISGDGSALISGASYMVWVYVFDKENNSFGASRNITYTLPSPTIESMSTNGDSAISATWNISNNAYIRTSNSIRIWLSGANNTTRFDMGWYPSNTTSFTSHLSGDGKALVSGSSYTLWVYVYDASGASNVASRTVSFTQTRPTNFSWNFTPISGQNFNVTASEWNRLLLKLNEFRVHRKLPEINTFIQAQKGNDFTSAMFNQVVNTINTLGVTTPPPPIRQKDQTIFAYYFDDIVKSLKTVP